MMINGIYNRFKFGNCARQNNRGVAILWHKKYDSLISVLRLEVDWCIAIKVEHNNNVFVMFNVYTPYEC